ncbi:MAG TPA: hypothetical protein VFA37_08225 [Gaiellaceae bacterium]|nr:hypothetical protein [Gaiellaceae bacterium]
MATRGQTHAKRARELELKERRERKQAKKAEAAARRLAGDVLPTDADDDATDPEDQPEPEPEWIR